MAKRLPYRHYGLAVYETGKDRTYAVGTDSEATAAARECCRESLWAFRPEFLARYTPEEIDSEIIQLICEAKCEDANEIVARLVGDRLGELIDDAIATDGREHFLSTYDGHEVSCSEIGIDGERVAFRI